MRRRLSRVTFDLEGRGLWKDRTKLGVRVRLCKLTDYTLLQEPDVHGERNDKKMS